ncbi:anti-sigma factor [Thalassobaculum fulvum]|uniref:Anti-sigma factor n=1 Tax=Thalassobaculum fulvum TaxID=1633335 RepID=A0A919CNC2_9PROT|nr:hypothetical protein [Thalassobaculum fulvum]GHD43996.1 anti-sigma factor [Thalassobaculum fulvum]
MSETEFSDEVLMAFADRELDPATAREIARRRETDPALDARIRVFEQTAGLARRALEPLAREPVPFRLLAAAQGANQGDGQGGSRDAGQDARRGGARLAIPRELMALAASVLLVIGIGAGFLASGWPDGETSGGLAALDACGGTGLSRALETTASGERQVEGGCAIVPVASYREEGTVCRAFQAVSGGASRPEAMAGIACRDDDGSWRTRVAVDLTPRPGAGDTYRPASGARVGLDALHTAAGLKAAPLSPADEQELLRNAWQSAR